MSHEMGAAAAPVASGAAVPPGESYLYTWQVPESAGPAEADGTSILWAYHSHVDEVGGESVGSFPGVHVFCVSLSRRMQTPTPV
jgi:hypothetical protein